MVPLLLAGAIPLAVLAGIGNPMPWQLGSGYHLAPTAGHWLAVAGLALAIAALVSWLVSRRANLEA